MRGCHAHVVALALLITSAALYYVAGEQPEPWRPRLQYVLPGCDYMLDVGDQCGPASTFGPVGCCPVGFTCDSAQCRASTDPTYRYSQSCTYKSLAYQQCGVSGTKWAGACCPDGFECRTANQSSSELSCQRWRFLQTPPWLLTAKLSAPAQQPGVEQEEYTFSPFPKGFNAVPAPLALVNNNFAIQGRTEPIQLKGINWFGFNVGATMFDGLWANSGGDRRTMVNDFSTIAHRIKLLGFNFIRIPFTFSDLSVTAATKDFYTSEDALKTDLIYDCMIDSMDTVKWYTTPPGVSTSKSPPDYMGFVHDEPNRPGRTLCNYYLPKDSVLRRFLFSVRHLVAHGFYVAISFHPSANDPNPRDVNLYASNFATLWQQFVQDYDVAAGTFDSYLKGRIFIDMGNEFDITGTLWDRDCPATGSKSYIELLNAAIPRIRSFTPDQIVMVEGIGQAGSACVSEAYPGMSWGDGFITDSEALRDNSAISDPSRWFEQNNPNVMLAPHNYGAEITGWDKMYDYGDNLFKRLRLSWGTKALGVGTTSSGQSIPQYPVVLGEFGGQLADDENKYWLDTLKAFLNDRNQVPYPPSWAWWCWNANSDDTGGIVVPGTWLDIEWRKIEKLSEYGWNLQPWYL